MERSSQRSTLTTTSAPTAASPGPNTAACAMTSRTASGTESLHGTLTGFTEALTSSRTSSSSSKQLPPRFIQSPGATTTSQRLTEESQLESWVRWPATNLRMRAAGSQERRPNWRSRANETAVALVAYGYNAEHTEIVAEEAAVVKEAAQRILAGDSLRSVCTDLNDRAVPTVTGRAWSTTVLRNMLMSARLSGQREHKGEIVSKGNWPGILTPTQTSRLRSLFSDPNRRTNRTPRSTRSRA